MIAVGVHGLNRALGRRGAGGWIGKQELALRQPQGTRATFTDARRPRAKRRTKVFPANGSEKRAGVATLRERKR